MTSHSPLLGCSHRCAQQVAENSWGKSKTSRQSYLMAWSARPLSQMSCNLVPSEGAGPRATGGFDRQARQPIASLLLRQRTNQRPSNFHEATGASVRSRWTSSIMCGRPNGTEFGCVANTQKAPPACVTLLRHYIQNVEQRRGQLTTSLNSRDESNSSNCCFKPVTKQPD